MMKKLVPHVATILGQYHSERAKLILKVLPVLWAENTFFGRFRSFQRGADGLSKGSKITSHQSLRLGKNSADRERLGFESETI